jgi:hypothetical protein
MARRSPRKKNISSKTIVDSDDEDFVAVASDDTYASLHFSFVLTHKVFSSIAVMKRILRIFHILTMMMTANLTKTATVTARIPSLQSMVSPLERTVPQLQRLNQRMMISKFPPSTLLSDALFLPSLNSIEITPPPTPSPTKAAGGKKRAIANCESDDDEAFVPRYDI